MNELRFRRESGLCERCGISIADEDHVCRNCLSKQAARPGLLPTQVMGESAFRRAAGLCWLCGLNIAVTAENLCEVCDTVPAHNRAMVRRRRAA